jgi:hypothetical protein
MPAFILMIRKPHAFARCLHQNTKPHLIFDLVWLLKTGEHETSCKFVLESRRKVGKRKLDFLFATQTPDVSFTSLFAGASSTRNLPTMVNDSVLHAQQQWQWDHCIRLVIISVL